MTVRFMGVTDRRKVEKEKPLPPPKTEKEAFIRMWNGLFPIDIYLWFHQRIAKIEAALKIPKVELK